MTQAQIAALLGRPLTASEIAGFEVILSAAIEQLQTLICSPIAYVASAERTFDTRKGYRTAFVDLFTSVTEVKLAGVVIDPANYTLQFFDDRNGTVKNSIVFSSDTRGRVLTVTGSWGFDTSNTNTIPADLQLLIAKLFDASTKKDNGNVKSKKIEDFNITFMDESASERFYVDNSKTINKYSICDLIDIKSGEICNSCRLTGCGC